MTRQGAERLARSPSRELRLSAVSAYSALICKDDSAVAELARLCADPEPEVREAAACSLARACAVSPSALDAVQTALRGDPQVRAGIARGLGAAAQRSDAAFDLLCRLAGDADGRVRAAAAEALGEAGEKRPRRVLKALGELLSCGAETDEYLSQGAALALAHLLGCGARGALSLVTRAARDGCESRRWCAARALAGARHLKARSAQRALRLLARDSSALVRAEVAITAGALAEKEPAAARGLLERLADDRDDFVRSAAREAVGRAAMFCGEWAVQALTRFSKAPEHSVRMGAAVGLGLAAACDRRAVGPLCDLARDRWAVVRGRAALALGSAWRVSPQARRALLSLAADANPLVRATAARSIGAACGRAAAAQQVWQALEALCRDEYAEVRRNAIAAVGELARRAPSAALSLLEQRLADAPITELAGALAAALAAQREGRALAVTRIALAAPDENLLREIARQAHDPCTADLMAAAAQVMTAEPLEHNLDRIASLIHTHADNAATRALAGAARAVARTLRASTLAELPSAGGQLPRLPDFTQVLALVPEFDEASTFKPALDCIRAAQTSGRREDKARHLEAALEALAGPEQAIANSRAALYRHIGGRFCAALRNAVSMTLRALREQADLRLEVIPARLIADGPEVTIALRLHNEGSAPAHDIALDAQAAPHRIEALRADRVAALAPGEEALLPLRLTRPAGASDGEMTTVTGAVTYHDPTGAQRIGFASELEFTSPPRGPCGTANPYAPGKPLPPGSPLFVGRDGVFEFLRQALHGAYQENVVALVGPRRIGKTSILRQAERRLSDVYWPIFVDVQGMLVESVPALLHALAQRCQEGVGAQVTVPAPSAFAGDPAVLPRFLGQVVRKARGRKRLLIMLDEFDDLEHKVRSGALPESAFAYLRHLIQHSPGVAFLLCGTNRLEELGEDYWSFLFNLAIYHRIGRLSAQETRAALVDPMRQAGICCDDLAAYRVWQLSGGQPYFVQLIRHYLVGRCQRAQRPYLTYDAVENCVGEVCEWAEGHLRYLWELGDALEQAALAAICFAHRECSAGDVADALRAHDCRVAAGALQRALDGLVDKDLVAEVSDSPTRYRPTMGLLAAWVRAQQPLARAARLAAQGA